MEPKVEDLQNQILDMQLQQALEDPNIPKIYFNGFINVTGTADIIIVLKQNNRPIALLNTSYTIAKTLVEKLGSTISDLEEHTGNTIMTTDYIQEKMVKDNDQNTTD
jgi:hypothetical protein